MRNIILKIFIFSYLFITSNIAAQYVSPESNQHKTVRKGTFDLSYKNLVGTVYVNDSFEVAHISIPNKNYPTRYDAFHDEMEIKEKDNEYYLPKTYNCIVTFKERNQVYRVYNFKSKNGFYRILVNGDTLSLLIKEKIKLYQEIEGNGITAYKPPTLKQLKDQLFYADMNNNAFKLPKKKKEFYLLFTSNAKLVQKFAKEKNLNIKDTNDLIKLFDYYNSLK